MARKWMKGYTTVQACQAAHSSNSAGFGMISPGAVSPVSPNGASAVHLYFEGWRGRACVVVGPAPVLRDVRPGIPLNGAVVGGGVRAQAAVEGVRASAAGKPVVAVGPAQDVACASAAEPV